MCSFVFFAFFITQLTDSFAMPVEREKKQKTPKENCFE